MVDLQIKLCSCPAISPQSGGEGEEKKADVLLDFMKSIEFNEVKLVKAPDLNTLSGFRPNIIAHYKGLNAAKTVWIMTHLDVVPPGDLSRWDGNPYKAWIEKGKIYGRGVEDNQQDLVASLFAVKAFQEEGVLPCHDVGLMIVADEETGSKKGIDYVLRTSNPFREDDVIIVPDAGNSDGTMIEVAEKSLLWLKITTLGKQTHGSTPEKGINSLKAASYFITEAECLYSVFNNKDSLFEPPISTFEPTKKEANVPNINTIPGDDVFYMDCRILPQYDVREVENKIKEIAFHTEKKFGVKIDIKNAQKANAAPPTSPEARVVGMLKKAVKAVYNKNAEAIGIGGGTVAASFRRAGFNAACWSKTDETAHQPNEYCIIENMVGDSKVFAHIFLQE